MRNIIENIFFIENNGCISNLIYLKMGKKSKKSMSKINSTGKVNSGLLIPDYTDTYLLRLFDPVLLDNNQALFKKNGFQNTLNQKEI